MSLSGVRGLVFPLSAYQSAGLVLAGSVLLSIGLLSWLSSTIWLDTELGTWTVTGTVARIDGDPSSLAYVNLGTIGEDYTLVGDEFDSKPSITEGDHVVLSIANDSDPHSYVYDWRIIKLESSKGTWTARDYSTKAAAATALIHPGFGLNPDTLRWIASIFGVALCAVAFMGLSRRRAHPDANVARSTTDRGVVGCSIAIGVAMLIAAVVVGTWLHALSGVAIPP